MENNLSWSKTKCVVRSSPKHSFKREKFTLSEWGSHCFKIGTLNPKTVNPKPYNNSTNNSSSWPR